LLLIKVLLNILLLVHYAVLVIICSNSWVLTKNRCFYLFTSHRWLTMISILVGRTIWWSICVIVVNAVWVLLRPRIFVCCYDIFRTTSRLYISNIHTIYILSIISRISTSMHLLSYLSGVVNIILFIIRLVGVYMTILVLLNLSRLQTSTSFFLVHLVWLFLWTSIKITTCYRKLFNLYLRIYAIVNVWLLTMIFILILISSILLFQTIFLAWWTLRIDRIWIYLRREN